jgi:hypothetical protein
MGQLQKLLVSARNAPCFMINLAELPQRSRSAFCSLKSRASLVR